MVRCRLEMYSSCTDPKATLESVALTQCLRQPWLHKRSRHENRMRTEISGRTFNLKFRLRSPGSNCAGVSRSGELNFRCSATNSKTTTRSLTSYLHGYKQPFSSLA